MPSLWDAVRRRPLVREALIVAFYAGLSVVYTGLWSDWTTRCLAGVDPVQDALVVHTVSRQLLFEPGQLFEGVPFFPSHKSILYADPLLGAAVLVLPIRPFTDNPVLLFNVALLAGLTLTGYGFYRLGLRLSGDRGAALLAGIAVPFTAQQMYHLGLAHLPYLSIAWFPFLILSLLWLLDRPSPGSALATGVTFALQAGTDGYYAFCSVFLAILTAAWRWRAFRELKTWIWVGVAAAIGTVLLLPYVTGFAALKGEATMHRGIDWSLEWSTDLACNLFQSQAYLWRGILDAPSYSKGGPLFPGLTVLVFAALGLRRPRGPYVAWLAAIVVFFFVLSLGPELRFRGAALIPVAMPYRFFWDHVPFFDAMRHPTTFAVPGVMGLALLATLGLARSGLTRRAGLLALVLAAMVAETLTPPPRRDDRGPLPEAYRFLATQPPGAILDLPLDLASTWQWWAIYHQRPIVNGQLGFEPDLYVRLDRLIRREWARKPAGQDMEDWSSVRLLKAQVPITYLILHTRAGLSGYLTSNVDASRRAFELIHESPEGDRVYRVRRGGRAAVLRRHFRDDQVAAGRLTAVVSGTEPGAMLRVEWNDELLEERPLGAEPEPVEWALAAGRVRYGINRLVLKTAAGEVVLDALAAQ